MEPFTYQAPAQRVVFGSGTLGRIGEEAERLGCRRVAVVTTPGQRARGEEVAALLGERAAGVIAEAVMHTPVMVTEKVRLVLDTLQADGLVAVGGGSAIGLAKALALRTGLPQIVIPTTYAGSEATSAVGQTENGRKTTLSDPRVLARTILYDIDLTLSLPVGTSVTSGFNAMAHAVEALYAPNRNPVTSQLALQGIDAFARALPVLIEKPEDGTARSDALFGAWACGTSIGTVSTGLHHKICHVLGGTFGLPHAETHTVILPHATAFNEAAAEALLAPVAGILGADTAAEGLFALARRLGAPMHLEALGLRRGDIMLAAERVAEAGIRTPRTPSRDEMLALLEAAF